MNHILKKIVFISGFTVLTTPAFSEIYGGVSLGQADPENAEAQTSWELKAGYRINNYIAVEGFYLNLGEAENSSDLGTLKNEIDGVGVSILGIYPINETVDVYGKLGLYSWDANTSFQTNNANLNASFDGSESDNDLIYGAGVAWKVNELLRLNVAYDAVNFNEFDESTDVYSVGASIIF